MDNMLTEGEVGNIPSSIPCVTVELGSINIISGRNKSEFDFEYECVRAVNKSFHHCVKSVEKASKNFISDTEGMISLEYIVDCGWSIEEEDWYESAYELFIYPSVVKQALIISRISLKFYQDRKVNKNLIKIKDKVLYDCIHDREKMRYLFNGYLKYVGCWM